MKEKSIYALRREARDQAIREAQERYPIYDGIPVPEEKPKHRGKCFFPTDRLQVGQAFTAPHEDYGAVSRNVTRRNNDGSGRTFVVRVREDALWVWRVK